MPKGEFRLAWLRRAAGPYCRGSDVPEISEGLQTHLTKADDAEAEKDQNHPGRGNVGEPRHKTVAVRRNDREERARGEHSQDPAESCGEGIGQFRHGELEVDA